MFHSHDEAQHTAKRAAVGAARSWDEDPSRHDYVCLIVDLRRKLISVASPIPWTPQALTAICATSHAQYAVIVWRVDGVVFCVLEHPLGRLAWLFVDGGLVPTSVASPSSTGCAPGGVVAVMLEYAVEHTAI